MSGLLPSGPLSYTGSVALPYITRTDDPTTSDDNFTVPTVWVNTSSSKSWILVSKPQGVADWKLFGGSSGAIFEIDTPSGNATPLVGIINFAQDGAIVISATGNTVTFSSPGGGTEWISVSGTTQALEKGNAYVNANVAQTVFSLPATAAFGDFYIICGVGAGGWTISQGAGQSIILGNVTSTVGAGGSITSTLRSDSIQIVCVTANTGFKALTWGGNLTVV